MTATIIDCAQRSPEWFAARLGRPTASCFADVMAGGQGKMRWAYMRRLAGEIVSGLPAEDYRNAAMDRGNEMEAEARAFYAMTLNVDVEQVGFIANGRVGASPDGLVGDEGMLEIKTENPAALIDRLLNDALPTEHVLQCQGSLWVAERAWIDLVAYYRGMPMWRRRIRRDENAIKRLELGVSIFLEELDALVAKVKGYGT